MNLGGESYEIVGVMPESFRYPSSHVDVYIPFSTIPDDSIPRIRPVRILSMVARMKPGVTVAQANAELNTIARGLADEYPDNKLLGAASRRRYNNPWSATCAAASSCCSAPSDSCS